MNNLTLQKDYTIDGQEYQLVLPMNVEVLIPRNESVRLLSKVTEGLDYSKLMQAYSQKGRTPKVNPITMVKIVLYANMLGLNSTRAIEQACRQNINFMWLLRGAPAPDHNSINRFMRKRFSKVAIDIHTQIIERLIKLKEVDLTQIYIDGTKIEANANKYTFVWKKSINKFEQRLVKKIELLLIHLNIEYLMHEEIEEDLVSQLDRILRKLQKIARRRKMEFVYGSGKRKSQIQKDIEKIREYLEKIKRYRDFNEKFGTRNSFSKTDPDATFMRMKDDHMRNAQLKPGYNLQLAVSGEYIVGVDISSYRNDNMTLIGFVNKLERQYGERFENFILDAGYESEENYLHLASKGYVSFIKPSNHEIKKKRKYKKQIGRRENMTYDKEKDEFICHNNRRLKYIFTSKRKTASGYETKSRVYECESCENCEHRNQCYRGKKEKRIYYSPIFSHYREISQRNIESEQGILFRMNRSIQVEGAIGILKQDYKFRRFRHRGQKKVLTESLLYAIAFNINKLHNKIQDNRLGFSFFCKDTVKVA
jgi:transposase